MTDPGIIVDLRSDRIVSPPEPASTIGLNSMGFAEKRRSGLKPLTLGSCIASVCEAYGLARAEGILRFAVNSGILVFRGGVQVEIAPRDPRDDGTTNPYEVTGLIRFSLEAYRQRRPETLAWKLKSRYNSAGGRSLSGADQIVKAAGVEASPENAMAAILPFGRGIAAEACGLSVAWR